MGQYGFILDDIDHETMKALVDAHYQDCLPGKGCSKKTTGAFLMISYKLYSTIFKPTTEKFEASAPKNFQVLVCFITKSMPPTPPQT